MITKKQAIELAVFSSAGAVGGIFAFLSGVSTGGVTDSSALGFLTAMLGGAIAAGIGIYLLTAADTQRFVHCIFFAIVCGISWEPVIKAAQTLVVNSALESRVNSANFAIESTPANPDPLQISRLTRDTADVITRIPSSENSALRVRANDTASAAVAELATSASTTPEAIEAIAILGRTAAESGVPGIARQARSALESVSGSESDSTPEIRDIASDALQLMPL